MSGISAIAQGLFTRKMLQKREELLGRYNVDLNSYLAWRRSHHWEGSNYQRWNLVFDVNFFINKIKLFSDKSENLSAHSLYLQHN